MAEGSTEEDARSWSRCRWADVAPAMVCMAVGLAFSVLPHLVSWYEGGQPVWIADNDELLYLSMAAQSYHHHPFHFGDPLLPEGGATTFPWLVLGPAVALARGLGIGTQFIGLLWRIGGGLGMGLSFFALIRQGIGRAWPAAGLAILLLADCGMLGQRPVIRPVSITAHILSDRPGALFGGSPSILGQWRIMSPALNMPFLLLHLWLVRRAREEPSRKRIALSGLGFGLLFYVYFYYWTAAGSALLLALAIDAGHRRIYFLTGLIGGLIGLPSVLANAALRYSTSPEWLQRTDKFLPIDRFSELLISRSALVLMVIGLAWLWIRRRDLVYLACLSASGTLLANHQVVTGLQIENFHWLYVRDVPLALLFAILAWDEVARRPALVGRAGWLLACLCVVEVADGLWLRAIEGSRSADSRGNVRAYRAYETQRLRAGVEPLEPLAVVAGDEPFVNMAIILEDVRPLYYYGVQFSPSANNAEWDERIALNAYLRGLDRAAYRREQEAALDVNVWGSWAPTRAGPASRLEGLLAVYDRIAADPETVLDRFRVRYVALPGGQGPPASLSKGWRRFEDGRSWTIWERQPGGEAARRAGADPMRRIKSATSRPARDATT